MVSFFFLFALSSAPFTTQAFLLPPLNQPLPLLQATRIKNDVSTLRQQLPTLTKTTKAKQNGYDHIAITREYRRKFFHVTYRLNVLGLPLLMWYFALLFDKRLLQRDKDPGVQRGKCFNRLSCSCLILRKLTLSLVLSCYLIPGGGIERGIELRNILVRSGSVAFIKSGQAMSLRPDLLGSKAWAEELGKLVDRVDSFPDSEAIKIIESNLCSDFGTKVKAKDLFEFENGGKW